MEQAIAGPVVDPVELPLGDQQPGSLSKQRCCMSRRKTPLRKYLPRIVECLERVIEIPTCVMQACKKKVAVADDRRVSILLTQLERFGKISHHTVEIIPFVFDLSQPEICHGRHGNRGTVDARSFFGELQRFLECRRCGAKLSHSKLQPCKQRQSLERPECLSLDDTELRHGPSIVGNFPIEMVRCEAC